MKKIFSSLSITVFIFILILFYSCSEKSIINNPDDGISTISYSGKTYHTVQIGNQWWLKENLDVGTMITGTLDQTNDSTIEKYCYNDDPNNCSTYGGLYQWNEAMQYIRNEGTQGICPPGWHIPTETEFQALFTAVNNNANSLKAVGQGSGSGAGTNTSGFSALLAGFRRDTSNFDQLGFYAAFWSSTEYDASIAITLYMDKYASSVDFDYPSKKNGYSIRCIKD